MIAHIINAHMKHDASNHDNSRARVPLSGVLNSIPNVTPSMRSSVPKRRATSRENGPSFGEYAIIIQ